MWQKEVPVTKIFNMKMRLSMFLYNKIVSKETENYERKRTLKRNNHWWLELLCQILKLILAVKIFMIFQVSLKIVDLGLGVDEL